MRIPGGPLGFQTYPGLKPLAFSIHQGNQRNWGFADKRRQVNDIIVGLLLTQEYREYRTGPTPQDAIVPLTTKIRPWDKISLIN